MLGIEGGIEGVIVGGGNALIDLPGVSNGVVGLGGAGDDFEVRTRDDHVGGVGAAGPFLAVGAVFGRLVEQSEDEEGEGGRLTAEGGHGWLAGVFIWGQSALGSGAEGQRGWRLERTGIRGMEEPTLDLPAHTAS